MKSAARTVIWILIFAAAIAAYVLLAQRASAQSLPPVSWLETRVRTVSATYFFEGDPAAVLGMYFDTSCTVDGAGTWRYNEDNEIVLSSRGGSVTLAGAKAVMDVNLGTLQEPVEPDGVWFRVVTSWRMAWRWSEVPQRIIRPDGSTFEMNLPACDAGPFLPLLTSGPADGKFIAFIALCIMGIFALHSNRRPTPPK